MNRRTAAVFVIVVTAATIGQPVAAAASPRAADGVAAAVLEEAPASVETVAPWSGPGRSTAAESAESLAAPKDVTGSGPEHGVDAETYRRQKAAAVWSPALTPTQRLRPAPAVPATSASLAAAVPTVFNGINQVDAGGVAVPDTIVGKSPTRVLEATNGQIRLLTTAGATIQSLTLNDFFDPPGSNGDVVDPKVYYDINNTNDRYYVTGMQRAGRDDTDTTNDVSRIWIAISRTPDPGTLDPINWCRYNLDAIRGTGTPDKSWADQPVIGVGVDSFSFSANQFRFTDRTFAFSFVRVWNKNIASNNTASCPSMTTHVFQMSSTAGDVSRFSVQPAQHYTAPSSFAGTTNPAYFLSTTNGSSTQYHVHRLRNVASGSPTMSTLTLTGASYGVPPSSTQPGSAVTVDTSDNRVTQVAGRGNTVAGVFTTNCNFTTGTPNESCVRTPTVTVGQNGAGGLTATLTENTFVGYGDTIYAHHPSIALNSSNQVGSSWQFSGDAFFLSSEARIKTGASWAGVSTYAGGTCALPESTAGSGSARAGDYSGAQTDSANAAQWWLAGEQAVTISGVCRWRTRVALLTP